MALTLSVFRARFPEFALASDSLLQSRIDAAILRTPEDVWGDLADEGSGYLAAHLMALTPGAIALTRNSAPGNSPYREERERLEMIVSRGYCNASME